MYPVHLPTAILAAALLIAAVFSIAARRLSARLSATVRQHSTGANDDVQRWRTVVRLDAAALGFFLAGTVAATVTSL